MSEVGSRTARRETQALSGDPFDLVIVGGGIFGACALWDAVLRGMRVALIEKADFGGGASANCYKVAHGGIRYMQHLDIPRVRHSSHEKSAMIRVAPHLVQPLPIAIPTYGHGRAGKAFLRAGTMAYDLLTLDRNRRIADPASRSPQSRTLSRSEVLDAYPGLPRDKLTGAVVMYDGQFYNPPRLVYAFVASAVQRGATAVNYVEAASVKRVGHQDFVVNATDLLAGNTLELRARAVLNTAGPWAESLINRPQTDGSISRGTFSRDLCFVVPGRLHERMGLAVQGTTSDPDSVLGRARRHLFLVPWRDSTLVGVWHKVYSRGPDELVIEDRERQAFVDEINAAYPGMAVKLSQVRMWNTGLVPFGEAQSSRSDLSFGKRSRFVEHAAIGGPEGLFTLIGVRYTMGRGDSALAMKKIAEYLGHESPAPATDFKPLIGGDFSSFSLLCRDIGRDFPGLDAETVEALAKNHGSSYRALYSMAREEPSWLEPLPGSTVLGVEIVSAARNELAVKLSDIVFRRTDLATAGNAGDEALSQAADLAAAELGWTADQRDRELLEVTAQFPYGYARLESEFCRQPL